MKNKLKTILLIILVCGCVLVSACNTFGSPINTESIGNENNFGGFPSDSFIDEKTPNGNGESPDIDSPLDDTYQKYILVKTNGLNVRSGAGREYSALCSFNAGDMLGYFGTENGWYVTKVRGVTGYVNANSKYTELRTLKKGSDSVENVIDVGLEYLGTPYVYGAVRYHNGKGVLLTNFTTNAFDCSSYMQYAFFVGNGDMLGLTTRNQVLQGTRASKSEIERGDLLFFTNASRYNNTGIERVGHVALYLGGNYILHTASDYAVIEQISSTRWSYFIEARRIAD